MIRLSALAIAIAFGVCARGVTPRGSGANHASCSGPDIPVEIFEKSQLKLVGHHLSQNGWSEGSVRFQNETGRTITSAIVLVSYFDSAGKTIFAIPYFGGMSDSPEELMQIRPFIKTIFKRPIRPLETFLLEGTNLEVTRESPVRAQATLVDTEFDDGTNSVSFSSPSTNPMLLGLPDFFQLSADPRKLPDELVVEIALDERGRVRGLVYGPPRISDDLAKRISEQFREWAFFPATRGGYAVASKLSALLRFHDKGIPLPSPTCPFSLPETFPRTFVEIDFRHLDAGRWQVIYGGHPAHGKFEPIVSETISR